MIVAAAAPTRNSSGRRPRITDETLQDIANLVGQGQWAEDDEPAPTKSSGYQRAQSARDLLAKRHNIAPVKTSVREVEVDGKKAFFWSVGPYPQGESPRQQAA